MTRAMFATFLVALAMVLVANRSESIVGADSSGYANLARMIAKGEVTQPLPAQCATCAAYWRTPLGFVSRGERMASFYPIGLPLHLAIAGRLRFFVSPIAGVLLVLCTYWIAMRLHSDEAGLIAALLMGCCAVFVFQSLQPMSDVLAAMWSAAAIAASIESRTRPRFALLAGFAFGLAVLVRPTSLLLLPALVLTHVGRASARRDGRAEARPTLYFIAGGIPAAIALAWYDHAAFGTILGTGYAAAGATREFALAYFPARAAHYARWTLVLFSPIAIVAAVVNRRERRMFLLWFFSFFLFYSFYFPYDEWWYTRFLLPAYPALAIAAGIGLASFVKWPRVLALVVILIVAWQLRQVARFSVLYTDEDQHLTQLPPEWVARHLPPSSLVFSNEFSGALLYYSHVRPVRWDLAPVADALAFARASNAPVYALLMPHEEEPFQRKYGPSFQRIGTFRAGSLFVLKR